MMVTKNKEKNGQKMGYRRKIWGNMGKYLRKYGIVAGTEK